MIATSALAASTTPATTALSPTLPTAMVEIDNLDVTFGSGRHATQVLHGISARVETGRTVGIVGESGSGKSTLAKALVGFVRPSAGRISIEGTDISRLTGRQRSDLRRTVQLIPQDRAGVGKHRDTIAQWLATVRMPEDSMYRYPHEFSGGQRQRIAIARGLIVKPRLVIADEITSALDVSVQAEILNLIARLRAELNLTMLFISHNLAVVRQVSDVVAVMHRGVIVEQGTVDQVYENPVHPYTRKLLDSVPGAPGFSIG